MVAAPSVHSSANNSEGRAQPGAWQAPDYTLEIHSMWGAGLECQGIGVLNIDSGDGAGAVVWILNRFSFATFLCSS